MGAHQRDPRATVAVCHLASRSPWVMAHDVVPHHLAVILFFEGPLFYIRLWKALDLAVFVGVLVRVFHPERTNISHGLRTGVRCAGVLLVLFAIAV